MVIHFEYLSPFKGKMYLINIVDTRSKWLEVFKIASTSAKAAITNLRELFSRFGLPVSIHSDDNGPTFNSVEFKQFLNCNVIFQTT